MNPILGGMALKESELVLLYSIFWLFKMHFPREGYKLRRRDGRTIRPCWCRRSELGTRVKGEEHLRVSVSACRIINEKLIPAASLLRGGKNSTRSLDTAR